MRCRGEPANADNRRNVEQYEIPQPEFTPQRRGCRCAAQASSAWRPAKAAGIERLRAAPAPGMAAANDAPILSGSIRCMNESYDNPAFERRAVEPRHNSAVWFRCPAGEGNGPVINRDALERGLV